MTSKEQKPQKDAIPPANKDAKPVIAGQRLKSRKRDQKEKYEPNVFRDEIVEGLNAAGDDFEAAFKFLDAAGSRLNYRTYGESLFDILIAGGLLAPGGSVVTDGDVNAMSVFQRADTSEEQFKHACLVRDVLRRYKYLQITLEEQMVKVLKFLKSFSPEQLSKLAKATAYYLQNTLITAKPLEALFADSLVKTGLAATFVMDLFKTWYAQPQNNVTMVLKKYNLESRLLEFLPPGQRTTEEFGKLCEQAGGLQDLFRLQSVQAVVNAKRSLKQQLGDMMDQQASVDEMVAYIKSLDADQKSQSEVLVIIWDTLMDTAELNKKSDLQQDQILRLVHAHLKLFAAFSSSIKSQVALMVGMQNFCYEHQALLKTYPKLVLLFYKGDVIEEEAIMDWFNKSHSPKGKTVFLQSMQELVDWLKNAEEDEDDDDDEAAAAAN